MSPKWVQLFIYNVKTIFMMHMIKFSKQHLLIEICTIGSIQILNKKFLEVDNSALLN